MNEYTPEQLELECVSRLKDLGLNEYEAYVLVYLIRLGTGTAKDIAELDSVPRTRVYDAVEVLHDLGLVDIQYTIPRKFSAVSRETAVRKFDLQRRTTIAELNELFDHLDPVEDRSEEFGVWTVTGREAVSSRVLEYVDDAEEELIYMTVDDLLTEDHLDRLQAAADRGVEIYLAGVSLDVEEQIGDRIPSARLFETLWEWSDVGAGRLLVTDRQTALASVLVPDASPEPDGFDEVAIWGSGEHNSLVVVLRTIFTWRLEADDIPSQDE